ncbi:MAG TPA: succinylglutamate desuccinylase/aspartoacylase family protein [Polyangiales bacterium]|nr:succinylglutamate desuccinylase/aspartoacylase family protein [Polyangiales bacterium]
MKGDLRNGATSPVFRNRELVIEDFPRGEVSRLYVDLVANGLAQDILLPVLVARGKRDGPVFGLTAAVHGNELNGIRVIHDLMHHIDPRQLQGALVAVVVVNVPGLHRHQREFVDGGDLNHIFPGREDGNVAEVYAHRILDRIVKRFDYLVDLHTASFGRVNSLYVRADMTQLSTATMAYLQRPQIIVHNPPSDYTLRGAAMDLGIPSITLEVGDPQRFQPGFVKSSRIGLRTVLAAAGMLPRRPVAEGHEPVLCERSFWMYADRGGLLEVLPRPTELVSRGERVAVLRNAFGDVIREYHAPQDGIVIGKSANPVGQTGARILHLGVIASAEHGFQRRPASPAVLQGSH